MRTLSIIIIVCAVSICTFSSCKKSNVSPKLSVESIVFTINGTKHTLTSNVIEHKIIYEGEFKEIQVSASLSSQPNGEDMTLYIDYPDSLKTGTYEVNNTTNFSKGTANIAYHNGSGNTYTIYKDFTNPKSVVVNVTEIGMDYIKGNFSAVLPAIVSTDSPSVPDIIITNGEFYAKTAPIN